MDVATPTAAAAHQYRRRRTSRSASTTSSWVKPTGKPEKKKDEPG